jgi:hypothetical protein
VFCFNKSPAGRGRHPLFKEGKLEGRLKWKNRKKYMEQGRGFTPLLQQ